MLGGSLLVFRPGHQFLCDPDSNGRISIITLPILIYRRIGGVFNFGFAGTLGLILMLVFLVIVFFYHRIMSRVVRGVEHQMKRTGWDHIVFRL